MRIVRLFRLALIVAVALTAAGCGASDEAASGGAEIVPANAPAFVTVDTNADSSQWRQIEELIEKFPDGDQGLRMLRASFEEDMKLDWEQDVKPALGDEIDLVWLDFEGRGTNVVAVTKPKDEEKFRAAVQKGNASDVVRRRSPRRRTRRLARPVRLAGEDRPLQTAGAEGRQPRRRRDLQGRGGRAPRRLARHGLRARA